MSVIALHFIAGTAAAQQNQQLQIPSLVLNSFQQTFPKSQDVEWDLQGEMYKVEFETGWFGPDHHAWFDKTGKLVKQKEEISKDSIPQNIQAKVKSDFSGYKVDEVSKITEDGKVIFKLELETLTSEWKVVYDSEGNLLSKLGD